MQSQTAETKLADFIIQDCGNLLTRSITHACIVAQKPYLLEFESHEARFSIGQQRTQLPAMHISALRNFVRPLATEYSQALEHIFRQGLPPLAAVQRAKPASRSAATPAGAGLPSVRDELDIFGARLVALLEAACDAPLRSLQTQQFEYRAMHKKSHSLPFGALTFVSAIKSAFERVFEDVPTRETLFSLIAVCFARCLNESLQVYSRRFDMLVAYEAEELRDKVAPASSTGFQEVFAPTYPLGI